MSVLASYHGSWGARYVCGEGKSEAEALLYVGMYKSRR